MQPVSRSASSSTSDRSASEWTLTTWLPCAAQAAVAASRVIPEFGSGQPSGAARAYSNPGELLAVVQASVTETVGGGVGPKEAGVGAPVVGLLVGQLVGLGGKHSGETVGATVRPPVATRERPKEQGELHSTAWQTG